jgi:superfamily I DNA and RNA helicase
VSPIIQKVVLEPMNRMITEDLNQEKIQWVIENIDELFLDMEENENDTY